MDVVVGIKALNEENNIANAISSALIALNGMQGLVILADSGSTDRTVDLARRYPVQIIQLATNEQKSCGMGAQLAYQGADAEFFYMMDGDMTIDPDFIRAGIRVLRDHAEFAGVGGLVQEMNLSGHSYKIRAQALDNDSSIYLRVVDRLDCGGLYRVEALRQVLYFADVNLHAFEEFELGARLACAGWKLGRIEMPAIQHYGHSRGGYNLLLRRILTGYAGGVGEVLRASLGRPHFWHVCKHLAQLRNAALVLLWWAATILVGVKFETPERVYAVCVLLAVPIIYLSWRRNSISLGLYSLVSWNVSAIGMLTGFIRPRRSPTRRINSSVLEPQIAKSVKRD